ncbi:hypothetical protein NUW58_g8011 [Xylaria curta]|uniref:Uncharacterized protein n=1 Tax=Xylaria curta TaxID=42375 RepID=A0ACC1NBR3_9PEZI|nr:hypothetical protein NUW58_g8011 [Xylaria curta]
MYKVVVYNLLLLVVIIFLILKIGLCTIMLFSLSQPSLVTIGDATESFITNPDPVTLGLGTLDIVDSWELQREVPRHLTPSENGEGTDLRTRIKPRQWKRSGPKRRLMHTISRSMWTRTYSAVAVSISLLIMSIICARISNASGFSLSFEESSEDRVLWGRSGFITMLLFANLPQLLLSLSYFAYDALFTQLVNELEWNSYSLEYKPLRVSYPSSGQLATYRFQLPIKYSLFLISVSVVAHWLLSSALFVFVMDGGYWNSPFEFKDKSYFRVSEGAVVALGYSVPAILALLATISVVQYHVALCTQLNNGTDTLSVSDRRYSSSHFDPSQCITLAIFNIIFFVYETIIELPATYLPTTISPPLQTPVARMDGHQDDSAGRQYEPNISSRQDDHNYNGEQYESSISSGQDNCNYHRWQCSNPSPETINPAVLHQALGPLLDSHFEHQQQQQELFQLPESDGAGPLALPHPPLQSGQLELPPSPTGRASTGSRGQHGLSSKDGTIHICLCGQRCVTKWVLHRHIENAKQRGPQFPCSMCDAYKGMNAFRRQDKLLAHMKSVHGHINNFKYFDYVAISRDFPSCSRKPLVCHHKGCEYSRGSDFKDQGFREQYGNRAFNEVAELTKHMKLEHCWSPHPCQASSCNRVRQNGYFTPNGLKRHYEKDHPTIPTPTLTAPDPATETVRNGPAVQKLHVAIVMNRWCLPS